MKLTIVTITRDDATGCRRTVESAGSLRARDDVEHVVVDGGEPPLPSSGLPRDVRHLVRPPRGVADAFNAGAGAALGEWIWFLNGGDTVHPAADVDLVLRTLEITSADAIVFDCEREDGRAFRPSMSELWPPVFNWIPHQATFVRTARLRAIGGFSSRYAIATDLDLWYRLFAKGSTVDLVNHRVACFAAGGLSSTEHGRMARENLRVLWTNRRHLARHVARQALLVPYGIAVLVGTAYLGVRPPPTREEG